MRQIRSSVQVPPRLCPRIVDLTGVGEAVAVRLERTGGLDEGAQAGGLAHILEDAEPLSLDNQAALATCRAAAGKTKKEQHCSIVVPAP
jgi:hypothetical protein